MRRGLHAWPICLPNEGGTRLAPETPTSAPVLPLIDAGLQRALVVLASAVGAAILAASLLTLTTPALALACAALVALYVVTPVAKEGWVLFAPAVLGVPSLLAAGVLLALNAIIILSCLALPLHATLTRMPRVRAGVERLGARIRERRGVAKSATAGLAIFVLLPFHSGGAIVGSLAGRVLGLRGRSTFAAVFGATVVRFGFAIALAVSIA